jgi:hypothetical protein
MRLFRPFAADGFEGGAFRAMCQRDRLEGRLRNLSARAYVYGLDATRAFVHELSMRPGIPPTAAAACATFMQRFGYIRVHWTSLRRILMYSMLSLAPVTFFRDRRYMGNFRMREFLKGISQGSLNCSSGLASWDLWRLKMRVRDILISSNIELTEWPRAYRQRRYMSFIRRFE